MKVFSALLILVCSFGFTVTLQAEEAPQQLKDLKELNLMPANPVNSTDPLQIRASALREAAVTLGIQNAIKYRYGKINEEINRLAVQLDQIFDFRPLMIKDKMLPPIVVEANGAYSLEEDGSATSSMVAFEIIQDAKLIATAPQWRDYLIHDFPVNNTINPALHPKDDEEAEAWKAGVQAGWEEGIQIADRMAVENLNRLSRDFRGLVRFHWLEKQGVLSMPVLSVGDLDVYVNGKKMDVNKRIFRITTPSDYRKSPKDWQLTQTKNTDWRN